MLSPINNVITPYSYYNKDITFNGVYGYKGTKVCKTSSGLSKQVIDNVNSFINDARFRRWLKIRKNVDKQMETDNENAFIDNLTFWTVSASIAKLFGRKWNLDKYGKLSNIEKYDNNELKTVKHFHGDLLRPSSIDEYKNGLIAKTTTFYKSRHKKHWVIEYDQAGNNKLTEYYPTGKVKIFQFEEDNNLRFINYFDENGNYIKGEKYNSDESLSSVLYYGDRQMIREHYIDGFLSSKLITYTDCNVTKNIEYDKDKNVQYEMEKGVDYSTYYHYTNGIKDWSETKYKDKNILYKKIEYDKHGNPIAEYQYDKNRKLCTKKEFPEPFKTVFTRYNSDGRIIATEIIDSKTGKVTRQYKKK